MNIASEKKGDVLIMRLDGDITLGNANEVNEYVSGNIGPSCKKVIFNLSKVAYLDSSAVGMIVAIYSTLQTEGGSLRLSNVNAEVMEIFKASSIDSFLYIDENEDESLIAIQ